MDNLYNKIATLCKAHDISPSRMCIEIGTSKSLMTELKRGRSKSLSYNTLAKIADYFDTDVGYFFDDGEKNNPPAASNDAIGELSVSKELIEVMERLTEQDRERVAAFARALAASEQMPKPQK